VLPGLPLWVEKVLLLLAWTWFVNLYHFMDGIDGLAAMQAVFVAITLTFVAESLTPLCLILAGCSLGFLRNNWPTVWSTHKMFLGDVVHKEKAASEHRVIVKAINYCVDDAAFNETEYDYRGNPKFSTMISKLCNYNRRSELIVEVVIKELHHNPEQQIMILAHNKTLIQYLFKAIEHKKVATVGYYLGGMKEAELKASETKKVIIATYAMASEGLDIKTLTTLIMATPKTDVCQSVGRILRVKHTTPVVIDIIDAHDLFINQWQKRKAYYKKQNYKIIVTENSLYCSDEKNGCWLTANNPKPPNKSIQLQLQLNNDDKDDDDEDVTKGLTNRKQPILTGMCFL
jgi:superfamily II DNA or RNA helicase